MKIIHKKINYRNLIFFYMSIIVYITCILIGSYTIGSYIRNVNKNLATITESSANQFKNQVDSIVNNIRKDYLEKVDSDEVLWLCRHDLTYQSYSNIKAGTDILSGSTYLSEYIRGYTFVNFKREWVLSNRGMYSYNLAENQEEVETIFTLNQNIYTRDYWNINEYIRSDVIMNREMIDLSEVSLIIRLPVNQKVPYAMLVINLSTDAIADKAMKNLLKTDVTIASDDGCIIYSSDKKIGDYIEGKFTDIVDGKQSRIKNVGNKSYYVSSTASDILNWNYVVCCESNIVSYSVSSIVFYSIIILSCCFFMLLIARILSSKIYKPVFQLTKQVKEMDHHNEEEETSENVKYKKQDALAYLEKSITSLVDNNELLEQSIEVQHNHLIELFQLRLLRGELNHEQLGYYIDLLHLKPKKYYSLLALVVKYEQNLKSQVTYDAVSINVIDNLPNLIKEQLFLPVLLNDKITLFIITSDDGKTLEQDALSLYQDITNYVSETYRLGVNIGISKTFTNLLEYRIAYKESIEALKNHELQALSEDSSDQNGIMFYSDISVNNNSYKYNITLEKQLKGAVDSCDINLANQTFDGIVGELIDHHLSSGEAYFYIQRYLMNILYVVSDAGLVIDTVFDNGVYGIFNEFNKICDMKNISTFVKSNVILPVVKSLSQFRSRKSSDIMLNIQKIIEETKGNITMTECAERLNYHPSYVWKIIKTEKNTTFSEYIAEYRMEQAKNLLLNSNMTVAEIGETLYYTNTQNFIRFFQKHEGITPGKYRRLQETDQ